MKKKVGSLEISALNEVNEMDDWKFSSFREYCGPRENAICDLRLAYALLGIDKERFSEESYRVIPEKEANSLF